MSSVSIMLTECIIEPGYFTEATQTRTVTNAGVHDVPVEITGGPRIYRHDLCSAISIEEAVNIMPFSSGNMEGSTS